MEAGIVHTQKGFRAFTEYRIIQRGRNEGMMEIRFRTPSVSRDKHWSWRTKKMIVDPETVYRMPE